MSGDNDCERSVDWARMERTRGANAPSSSFKGPKLSYIKGWANKWSLGCVSLPPPPRKCDISHNQAPALSPSPVVCPCPETHDSQR